MYIGAKSPQLSHESCVIYKVVIKRATTNCAAIKCTTTACAWASACKINKTKIHNFLQGNSCPTHYIKKFLIFVNNVFKFAQISIGNDDIVLFDILLTAKNYCLLLIWLDT